MTNGISVAMNKWLSFRVSLVWNYAGEPSLEDVDVIAFVELRDPDGVPGNGDEFYETVESGGRKSPWGSSRPGRRSSTRCSKRHC